MGVENGWNNNLCGQTDVLGGTLCPNSKVSTTSSARNNLELNSEFCSENYAASYAHALWPSIMGGDIMKIFRNTFWCFVTESLPIIKYNFIEDFNFPWCYAVSTGKYLPKFRMIVMPSSSGWSSLRRNDFYSTWLSISEDLNLHHHRYEKLKGHIFFIWRVKLLK